MAKEKSFTELKLKVSEAIDSLDFNNPNVERRQEVDSFLNAVGKIIRMDCNKMQYEAYRKNGGRVIKSLEDD